MDTGWGAVPRKEKEGLRGNILAARRQGSFEEPSLLSPCERLTGKEVKLRRISPIKGRVYRLSDVIVMKDRKPASQNGKSRFELS